MAGGHVYCVGECRMKTARVLWRERDLFLESRNIELKSDGSPILNEYGQSIICVIRRCMCPF